MTDYAVEAWLAPEELDAIEYSGYWNDAEAEREKAWYVGDGDFEPMERYLRESGLGPDMAHALDALRGSGRVLRGRGIDLAAGTLWAVPRLLAAGADHVTALELSRHRLSDLGPRVLEHYDVGPSQVTLALGSFYDLKVDDASLDFAFMCQALHHADQVDDLLAEIARVLKPDGVVVVIGEHRLGPNHYARAAARTVASRGLPRSLQRRLLGHELEPSQHVFVLPPDPVLGDHFYTQRQYDEMFERAGFVARRLHRPGGEMQGFLLTRSG